MKFQIGQTVWVLMDGIGEIECEYYRRTFDGRHEVKQNGRILFGSCPDENITNIPPSIQSIATKTDAELETRAKELLAELRAVQREIVRRYHAQQTPVTAVCGHGARDKTGLHCDCPTCANYAPF